MIVADTNLLAHLFLPGDARELADAVFEAEPIWSAPLLWRSEFRNILTRYMRHRNLALMQALQTMKQVQDLLHSNEYSVSSNHVLEITATSQLSAYDAEFVALARQLDIPLVTFDTALPRACPECAVGPEDFLKLK